MTPALLRIVYASRALAASDASTRAADVRAVLGTARSHNAAHGISGLLIVANGHFVQVLEGPHDAVEALYRKIGLDARHHDVSLLSRVETPDRGFGAWSMGLVERSEPEAVTTARLKLLRDRLAADPEASAADFCRLLLAPSVNPVPAVRLRPASGGEPISSVAFASPTGMWSAAVLQHVSSAAMRRTGRTSVIDPADAAQRALIEYIDVEMPEIGPLRALSLAAEPGALASVAPLMERLSLLVFMMASSDAEGFIAYVQAWLDLPQVIASAPRVLVLAGMAPERVVDMLETLRAGTGLTLDFASVKLSDSAAVWRAAQKPLRDRTATALAPARPLQVRGSDAVAELVSETGCLQELLGLDGAIAAALVDAERCAALITLDRPGCTPRSFADDAEFLRGKWQLSMALRIDDPIEDIAITTHSCLSLYRALPRRPELFLAVVFDREGAPLAVARLRLEEIVDALSLLPI